MKKIPIYSKLLLAFFLLLFAATAIKGKSTFDFSQLVAYVILIISMFSFGLFMVFSLENRRERITSIQNSLRKQDAHLFNIYQIAKCFNSGVKNDIRTRIDDYLVDQVDLRIEDIDRSSFGLVNLFGAVSKIKPANQEQSDLKLNMIQNLENISMVLKEVSFKAANKMSSYEWLSLLVLYGVIIFSLLHENANTLVSILIISIISSALALTLLILREMDKLHWQEQKWVWEPLTNLFEELDLVPYFPDVIFVKNRVAIKKIKRLKRARIAYYPDPYPNFKRKKIKLVRL